MNDILETIHNRNIYYYKQYSNLLLSTMILFIFTIVMLIFFYLYGNPVVQPIYVPTTANGKVIFNPPIQENHLLLEHFTSDPVTGKLIDLRTGLIWTDINKSDLFVGSDANEYAIIKLWSERAALAMFNIDYKNYRISMQKLRLLFTANGYNRFIGALIKSRNMMAIRDRKHICYAVLRERAIVANETMINNRRVWDVRIPVSVFYENNIDPPLSQSYTVQLEITRVSTTDAPRYGIQIFRNNMILE